MRAVSHSIRDFRARNSVILLHRHDLENRNRPSVNEDGPKYLLLRRRRSSSHGHYSHPSSLRSSISASGSADRRRPACGPERRSSLHCERLVSCLSQPSGLSSAELRHPTPSSRLGESKSPLGDRRRAEVLVPAPTTPIIESWPLLTSVVTTIIDFGVWFSRPETPSWRSRTASHVPPGGIGYDSPPPTSSGGSAHRQRHVEAVGGRERVQRRSEADQADRGGDRHQWRHADVRHDLERLRG